NLLLGGRPRFHELPRGERHADEALEAAERGQDHDRVDRDLVPSRRRLMLASVEVQTALLVLKICFLVLLYLFIWRIVRSASREVRLPQESFILAPRQAAAAGLGRQQASMSSGTLVAVQSAALEKGARFELNAKAVTVGRAAS